MCTGDVPEITPQILQDCEGVQCILGDIIIHAEDNEQLARRLDKLLCVISSRGVTLNKDTCRFTMNTLEFRVHVLSDRGIGPTEEREKAMVKARKPKNAAEVRGFSRLSQL